MKVESFLLCTTFVNPDLETISGGLGVVVFNATFNNISVISWQSVLLGEETGAPVENH
jgi:hypothetical protein